MWNRHVPLDVLFDGTEEDRRADVFFSQGTVYPPGVFDEWGFVGCMGTVAFRATPAAQTLLRQAIRTCATGTNCDDQVAMNRALSHKYGVKWNRDSGVGVGVLGSGPGRFPSSARTRDRVPRKTPRMMPSRVPMCRGKCSSRA